MYIAYDKKEYVNFEELSGKHLTHIERSTDQEDDYIKFFCSDGTSYVMYHEQDCCETVNIEDITEGYQDMLTDATITEAYVSIEKGKEDDSDFSDTCTWTFYRIVTNKGLVVIRWYGTSNGYYSEVAEFCRFKD